MSRYQILPKILIVTEGHTETIYLDHLRERGMGCSLMVRKSSDTDPKGILRSCLRMVTDLGLNLKRGDKAYIVFDWDRTDTEVIRKVLSDASKKGVGVVLSKPCFEIVFLAHFLKDVSTPKGPDDVLGMLEKYLPNYDKTKDYWEQLLDKQKRARDAMKGFGFDCTTDFDTCCNGSNVFDLFDVVRSFK